MYRIFMKHTI